MTATTSRRSAAPAGFTLVEVLVTMSLVSIALLGLVPLSYRIVAASNQSTAVTQRTAAMNGEVERVGAREFGALVPGSTCTSVTAPAFPHLTCVRISAVDSLTLRVVIVVTPVGTSVASDSTTLERSRAITNNPLNLP